MFSHPQPQRAAKLVASCPSTPGPKISQDTGGDQCNHGGTIHRLPMLHIPNSLGIAADAQGP